MTRDALKAQLLQYRSRQAEIRQIANGIKRLEETLGAPKTANLDGMPHSSGIGDPVLQAVVQHEVLLERYQEKMLELAAAQAEIENMLESLDSLERRLMRHRYIEGLSWEEVCVEIGYSWRQTHNIHARALNQLLAMQE